MQNLDKSVHIERDSNLKFDRFSNYISDETRQDLVTLCLPVLVLLLTLPLQPNPQWWGTGQIFLLPCATGFATYGALRFISYLRGPSNSTPSRDTPHPLWTTLVWCAFLLAGAATVVFRCVSADSTLAILAPRIYDYDITDILLPLLEQHPHVPALRQILILGTFCFSILICVLVCFLALVLWSQTRRTPSASIRYHVRYVWSFLFSVLTSPHSIVGCGLFFLPSQV